MQVFVRDNDVNGALRVLKKKMQREGHLSRDEAAPLLREALRATGAGTGRGDPSIPQGYAQTARARGLLIEEIGGKLRQAACPQSAREVAGQNRQETADAQTELSL